MESEVITLGTFFNQIPKLSKGEMTMIFRNYKKENKELREKNNELEEMIINLKGELKATEMQLDAFCTKEDGIHKPSIICKGCRNLVTTFDWGRTNYLCALDNKCKDKEMD